MTKPDRTIGLIGLGNAGGALVSALKGRYGIRAYDRDPARLADAGIEAAGSAGEVARDCDIVLLSLPTPAASLEVAREMSGELRPGHLIVETSTVRPADIEDLRALCAPRQARVVDSAIVGGIAKLAAGRGVFLVGARKDDLGPLTGVLETAAEEVFYLGDPGNGMRMKLVVNAVSHTVFVVLVEAAALALAQGVPVETFYRLMQRESGLTRPLTHRFGERVLERRFEGGMSTVNARKDSSLILDIAHQLGVPLFAIPASHTVYDLAIREGLGGLDYASLSRLWEKWLGQDFVAEPHEKADG